MKRQVRNIGAATAGSLVAALATFGLWSATAGGYGGEGTYCSGQSYNPDTHKCCNEAVVPIDDGCCEGPVVDP
jgi:hypothetical protein